MIRFLHSSDWHLGRHLFGRSLLEDQAFALEQLVSLIMKTKPHGLLIAGDVFDRSVPPEEAVSLLNAFLTRVIDETATPVFMIPGNHDSKERLGFAAHLLRDRKLTIFSRVKDAFNAVLVQGDGDEKALVYGIPYVEPIEIAHALGPDSLDTELARSHDLALKALCARMLAGRADENKSCLPTLLLCHAFVAGGEVSESEKEISIGGACQVSPSAFDGFTYTALGHLHKPQFVAGDRVRYSGSLYRYSKSEIGHRKSVSEIRLNFDQPDAQPRLEVLTHELEALRELRYIEGEVSQLIAEGARDPRRDDYILAGYTDRGAVIDTFAKLRAVYPNLLHVSRAAGSLPSSLPLATRAREEQSELDLFSEFFKSATGTELSDDERGTLIELLTAARQLEGA